MLVYHYCILVHCKTQIFIPRGMGLRIVLYAVINYMITGNKITGRSFAKAQIGYSSDILH